MTAFKDWLNGLTSKSTPADADELYLRDSSGTPSSKKLTWANLKAALQTITDTVSAVGGSSAGSALTVNQTFNTTGTPAALKVNVTDTASNAASLLADFQVGGVSKVSIRKNGTIKLDSGQVSEFGIGVFQNYIYTTSAVYCAGNVGFVLRDSSDTYRNTIYCTSANLWDFRNASALTSGQSLRVSGTYTDASNYRRVALAMTAAGVATLTPEGAGTGASGNVLHISGLPTSNPGPGILWNNAGTPAIGT